MEIYTFIAVNYNNSNFTKDYIESINKIEISKDEKKQIIIIDNNSNKKDLTLLDSIISKHKDVKLIKSDKNLGYFGGLNLGIREALKTAKKHIIVGNNDLTFDIKFIKKLNEINYEKEILVIAPNIITKDGRQQNPHVIKKVSDLEKIKNKIYFSNYYVAQILKSINMMFKVRNKKNILKTNNLGQMTIKRGIGACYILTENFFDFYEKLDDRVFLWGEEALLSNQVEEANGKTLYNPSIIINHHESATVSCIQSKNKYQMIKKSYKIYKKYL